MLVGDKPYAYVALVGDEDFWRMVLSQIPYYNLSNIVPMLFEPETSLSSFTPEATYFGFTYTPWMKIPVQSVKSSDKCFPTWFILDTGSPQSYLTEETCKNIFGTVKTIPGTFLLES